MRDVIFTNEHFYHIYNRGVDKRDIFMDDADRWRFVKSLCIFNDSTRWSERSIANEKTELTCPEKPFVKIHAFCMMTNHFHLLLEQITDNGIAKFMHKLGAGFTRYFNVRNERTGALFGGTFKAKSVNDDVYLLHLTRYIHSNPISLLENTNQANLIDKLSNYRWSSFSDYLGTPTYPFVETKFILNDFRNHTEYTEFMKNWKPATDDQIGHLYFDE